MKPTPYHMSARCAIIVIMTSSRDTIVDPDSGNTNSSVHRRNNDEDTQILTHNGHRLTVYLSPHAHFRKEVGPTPRTRRASPLPNHGSAFPAPIISLKLPLVTIRSVLPLEKLPHAPSDTPPSTHDHPQRRRGTRPAQWTTNNARYVNPQLPNLAGYLDGHDETNIPITANRHQSVSRLLGHPVIGRPFVHPSRNRRPNTTHVSTLPPLLRQPIARPPPRNRELRPNPTE